MRKLRKSKAWVMLALLSVLGLAASPSFAFGCCCAPVEHSFEHSSGAHHEVASAPVSPLSCHDHDAPAKPLECHDADGHGDGVAQVSADSHASQTSLSERCSCSHDDTAPLSVVESSASTFQFAPLAIALPIASFSHVAPDSRLVRAFASSAARPRSPDYARLPGRSPPAI